MENRVINILFDSLEEHYELLIKKINSPSEEQYYYYGVFISTAYCLIKSLEELGLITNGDKTFNLFKKEGRTIDEAILQVKKTFYFNFKKLKLKVKMRHIKQKFLK